MGRLEELAVLTAVDHRESALALGQRLREAVAGVVLPVPTTASVGVAVAPAGAVSDAVEAGWRLLERADDGMYQAKRGGRDQAVLATDA